MRRKKEAVFAFESNDDGLPRSYGTIVPDIG